MNSHEADVITEQINNHTVKDTDKNDSTDAEVITDGMLDVRINDTDQSEVSEEQIIFTINDLPTELIFYICDFLDARFLINVLKKVCLKFEDLFSRESYWRTRTFSKWPKSYPVVNYDSFDWEEACIEREDQSNAWCDQSQYVEHIGINTGQYAPIDVVHLMKNGSLLATGSRDKFLSLLDLRKWDADNPEFNKNDMIEFMSDKVHKGWIWSMASENNILATGSWDMYIKLWDIDSGCSEVSKFKCKSAILGLHYEPNVLIAGLYDKRVCLIDTRDGCIIQKRFHRQPVLCIAADSNYIIAGSEDKTISIYDRRAGALYKTIQTDKFTMCMSYGNDQLWIGDKGGSVHLYDTSHGRFNHVQTILLSQRNDQSIEVDWSLHRDSRSKSCDVGHSRKITGIVHSTGALFTSSTDHSIKVTHPTIDPDVITTLNFHNSDVARLAYQNGVLASAGSDIKIGIWRLKQYHQTLG